MIERINAIDLFSGAGGLSEGFLETNNYNFLAHVEWEKPMVDTLRYNLIKRWHYDASLANRNVVLFDVQKTEELMHGKWSFETKKMYANYNDKVFIDGGLDALIGNNKVDVIIGGPPCQAYSLAGRAQDPNSMKDDYRNFLFESFVKIVNNYKPKIIVFENVPGILSAKPGDEYVINRIYKAFDEIGYEIRKPSFMKNSIYSAAEYGVPQERKRVIIFGVIKNSDVSVEQVIQELQLLPIFIHTL